MGLVSVFPRPGPQVPHVPTARSRVSNKPLAGSSMPREPPAWEELGAHLPDVPASWSWEEWKPLLADGGVDALAGTCCPPAQMTQGLDFPMRESMPQPGQVGDLLPGPGPA